MITKLKVVFVDDENQKVKSNCIKYNLNLKKNKIVNTISNEKIDNNNIIIGGYNKDYAQPTKKELSVLEKK